MLGGRRTGNEYPFVVVIQFWKTLSSGSWEHRHTCSATAVSDTTLLTLGRCLGMKENISGIVTVSIDGNIYTTRNYRYPQKPEKSTLYTLGDIGVVVFQDPIFKNYEFYLSDLKRKGVTCSREDPYLKIDTDGKRVLLTNPWRYVNSV